MVGPHQSPMSGLRWCLFDDSKFEDQLSTIANPYRQSSSKSKEREFIALRTDFQCLQMSVLQLRASFPTFPREENVIVPAFV